MVNKRRRMADSELEFMENLLSSRARIDVLVRTAVRQTNDENVLDTLASAIKELGRFKVLLRNWLRETYEAGGLAEVDYDAWPDQAPVGNSRDQLIAALVNALEAANQIADQIERKDDDENGVQLRMIK